MAEVLRAPKGLDGVAVADTSIAKSDADGTLIYRGYEIKDLFEHSTFQESTYLILYGKLPTRSELEEFEAKMRRYSMVPHNVYELVKTIPREAHQMDVLRTAVSGLGATEGGISSEEQKLSILAQILMHRHARESVAMGPSHQMFEPTAAPKKPVTTPRRRRT